MRPYLAQQPLPNRPSYNTVGRSAFGDNYPRSALGSSLLHDEYPNREGQNYGDSYDRTPASDGGYVRGNRTQSRSRY